jgi:hypothetical protein
MFATAPPKTIKVEPLGVQKWQYENRSYLVYRNYRVTTPEVTVTFTIPAQSSEGEGPGEPRKWFVHATRIARPEGTGHLTELGQGLLILRKHSHDYLQVRWKEELNQGRAFDFAAADKTEWALVPGDVSLRDFVKARLTELFADTTPNRLVAFQFPPEDVLGDWELIDGKVRLGHSFMLGLEKLDKNPIRVEGRIIVETKEPFDPAKVTEVAAMPEWTVHSIDVRRAAVIAAKKGPQAVR